MGKVEVEGEESFEGGQNSVRSSSSWSSKWVSHVGRGCTALGTAREGSLLAWNGRWDRKGRGPTTRDTVVGATLMGTGIRD